MKKFIYFSRFGNSWHVIGEVAEKKLKTFSDGSVVGHIISENGNMYNWDEIRILDETEYLLKSGVTFKEIESLDTFITSERLEGYVVSQTDSKVTFLIDNKFLEYEFKNSSLQYTGEF